MSEVEEMLEVLRAASQAAVDVQLILGNRSVFDQLVGVIHKFLMICVSASRSRRMRETSEQKWTSSARTARAPRLVS